MAKEPKTTKTEVPRRPATAPMSGDERIAATPAASEKKHAAGKAKHSASAPQGASVFEAGATRVGTGRGVDKGVGKIGPAATAGGVIAAGAAATALLLSLRGSTPKPGKAKGETAHQPDGTDSSASFEARIADENTIPDTI